MRRQVSEGSEALSRVRTPANPRRQVRCSGSMIQGPASLKVPNAVSLSISGSLSEWGGDVVAGSVATHRAYGRVRPVQGWTRPDWKAKTTACTRSRSPNLASRRPTWDFTVASET